MAPPDLPAADRPGPLVVRRLAPEDRAAWDPLWQGYLDFYEHRLDHATTEATWARLVGGADVLSGASDVLSGAADMVGLGAERDGELVGLCHLVLHPSTWSTAPYCYLEDLFVAVDERGSGTGAALVAAAGEVAAEAGASKLYWQTHVTNATARRLYDRVAEHRGFVVYEVDLGAG